MEDHRIKRILDSAEKLFFQLGYSKVTIADITKDLNISRSTIYEHFESKDGLVVEVINRYYTRFESSIEEIVEDEQNSFRDKMKLLAKALIDSLGAINERFFNELQEYSEVGWQAYIEGRDRRISKYYNNLMNEGISNGILRNDVQVEVLVHTYLKLSEIAYYGELDEGFPLSRSEYYNLLIDSFIEGFRASS